MKQSLTFLALLALSTTLHAEDEKKADEGFQFTVVKENPITSTKNQNRSGTCWAYSSLGFFEAEMLRQGKGEWDFCEMFLAHKTYEDRAKAAVRMHGDISFSQGGSFYDCVYCMKNYGMVPEGAMPAAGTLYGDTLCNFNEFFAVLEPQVAAIAKGSQKKLSPIWFKSINSTLDTYLGQCPDEFTYKGKKYTPKSFMESTGLKMDDYVSLTSFSHHPFYESFIIEVQDNWRWAPSYNLPLDEFMQVMESAVKQGYTFAWGADVSEEGFSREGIAVCPDVKKMKETAGSDYEHWFGKSSTATDRRKGLTSKPLPEITVTQEMRQEAYDNWETTDDHGMLIYGIATDQNGKEYFMVKNSWGTDYKYKGVWYASKAFVAYKTMNILINKNAIPKPIAKKLGL
jgi:aminopeptidase C